MLALNKHGRVDILYTPPTEQWRQCNKVRGYDITTKRLADLCFIQRAHIFMKDQNLGRCNAVDRDEMGRDQNDNGISEKYN